MAGSQLVWPLLTKPDLRMCKSLDMKNSADTVQREPPIVPRCVPNSATVLAGRRGYPVELWAAISVALQAINRGEPYF